MNAPDLAMRFGGFTIHGMKLAFPIASLREVLPYQQMLDIPSPAQCVVGGINYRDAILPVIDLCRLLEKSTVSDNAKCILVVVVGSHLFGLLADEVTGIFTAQPDSWKDVLTTDLLGSVFHATVVRDDELTTVSVLSLEKIAKAECFPMISDEAAHTDSHADVSGRVIEPMMILKCGQLDLAIRAIHVDTTIAGFTIEKSALAMGHCLGVIHHMGMAIPLIDFQDFCGGGKLSSQGIKTAFIIALEKGKVAFLIDQIVDIVRIDTAHFNPVPEFVLALPALFSGIIPNESLPTEILEKLNPQSQCLVIDNDRLFAMPEVVSLASTNTFASKQFGEIPLGGVSHRLSDQSNRSMLLYDVGILMATPVDQLSMILPYTPDVQQQSDTGYLGIIESRGKSIPVFNLCQIQGVKEVHATSSSCILVVETEEQSVGFFVMALLTIANTSWEPEISELSGAQVEKGTSPRKTQLALFTIAEQQKMLQVKDLVGLASTLKVTAAHPIDDMAEA